MILPCFRPGLFLLFVSAGLLSAAPAPTPHATEADFEIAAAPSWVKAAQPPTDLPASGVNSGSVYLLIDRQENLEQRQFYYHEVRAIQSENGLQNGASISVTFNPDYERLTFHSIQLLRDGTVSDRLDRSRIKLSPNAKDPDRLIHDSSWSADLALDDVRVGDRIEYSVTREGKNPLRGENYSAVYPMQWSFPVARNAVRLIYSAQRKLQFQAPNGGTLPNVTIADDLTEASTVVDHVPARMVEEEVPEGYAPRQRLDVSEFQSWGEVARWASPLFASEEPPSPEMRAEIDRLRAIFNPEQRIVAALQFAGDKIRDLNFGSWVGTSPITPPNEVLRRRAGDDKDKAALLVALLRGCEIDAVPALVSDYHRGSTPERLPSPEVFDHAIVQVRLGQATHWIDPWRGSQRGPLNQIYVARYRYTLLLRSETDSLTPFLAPKESWPIKTITETYRVPAPSEAGELDVVSDYYGLAADQVRASFRENTREEMQKRYLNYYARSFPEAKPRKLVWYEELPGEDGCRVSEWYLLPHIWRLDDDKSRYLLVINPGDISAALGSTASPQRIDPWRLSYPSVVKEEINIEMFEDWPPGVEGKTTSNPFFRLQDEPSGEGSHLQLNYTYEALSDRVEPGEFPAYVKAVTAAKDTLGYTLRYNTPEQLAKARKPFTFNWAVAAAGLCFLGSASFVAFRYFRASKLATPRPPPIDASERLTGIGGWLILLAIGLLLRPVGYLKGLYDLMPTMLKTDPWRALTDPIESGFHAWWAPALLYELFFNLASLVFCLLLIALFFRKRAAWSRCFALFLVVTILGSGLDVFLVDHIPAAAEPFSKSFREIGILAAAAAILIPYVFRSKRVKATFRR